MSDPAADPDVIALLAARLAAYPESESDSKNLGTGGPGGNTGKPQLKLLDFTPRDIANNKEVVANKTILTTSALIAVGIACSMFSSDYVAKVSKYRLVPDPLVNSVPVIGALTLALWVVGHLAKLIILNLMNKQDTPTTPPPKASTAGSPDAGKLLNSFSNGLQIFNAFTRASVLDTLCCITSMTVLLGTISHTITNTAYFNYYSNGLDAITAYKTQALVCALVCCTMPYGMALSTLVDLDGGADKKAKGEGATAAKRSVIYENGIASTLKMIDGYRAKLDVLRGSSKSSQYSSALNFTEKLVNDFNEINKAVGNSAQKHFLGQSVSYTKACRIVFVVECATSTTSTLDKLAASFVGSAAVNNIKTYQIGQYDTLLNYTDNSVNTKPSTDISSKVATNNTSSFSNTSFGLKKEEIILSAKADLENAMLASASVGTIVESHYESLKSNLVRTLEFADTFAKAAA